MSGTYINSISYGGACNKIEAALVSEYNCWRGERHVNGFSGGGDCVENVTT